MSNTLVNCTSWARLASDDVEPHISAAKTSRQLEALLVLRDRFFVLVFVQCIVLTCLYILSILVTFSVEFQATISLKKSLG